MSTLITHAVEDSAHVRKGLDDTWHGIVAMDLVFEIDETFVIGFDEGFKNLSERHDTFADGHLAFLIVEISKVFCVHVE